MSFRQVLCGQDYRNHSPGRSISCRTGSEILDGSEGNKETMAGRPEVHTKIKPERNQGLISGWQRAIKAAESWAENK